MSSAFKLPTPEEIGHALAELQWWRVMHVQEVMFPYKPITASEVLALGYEESGLQNICGGAVWDGSKWVQSYTDRGWLQISGTTDREVEFLKSVEGCKEGTWYPADPPVSAFTERHVPRYSPALEFTRQTMKEDVVFAGMHGVPTGEQARFAIAAHNAGPTGALNGYREGDVDKYTANGHYSAYVMSVAAMVHNWIVAHPHWVYRP